MGVSFLETMSGRVTDHDGCVHDVIIDLRCASRRIGDFVIGGLADLSGTVHAEPWADGAACHGKLEVAPLLKRRIVYDLTFDGHDGAQYRLYGRKDVNPTSLLASMTSLATTISRNDIEVASGELRFDMNDIVEFTRSWNFDHGLPTVDLYGAAKEGLPTAPLLDEEERRFIRAFAEAILEKGRQVPAVDDKTIELAEGILPHLPPHLLTGLKVAMRALDTTARLTTGRRLADVPIGRRRRLIDKLEHRGLAPLVFALGVPVKTAHFCRRDYLDRVGLPTYENPVAEKPPRWLDHVMVPEALDEVSEIECDVVVIGTGAGGGPVAATLAEAGLGVLMIEEGRYHRRPQFAGGPEERLLKFWRDGGMNVTVGNVPIVVPLGRMVGGSTAINSGTCYRTPDAVLRQWQQQGLGDDFSPERFAPWLDKVDRELGVDQGDRRYLGKIADAIAQGAEEMAKTHPQVVHGPLRRNAPGCDGQGLCVVGCPTDAKRSSNVSWVPRALRAGAGLSTGLPVTRLLMRGSRCVGVEASGTDEHGAPRRLVVRARAVVVGCGTLHSPLLLKREGVRLPWLGRNLSIHPALGAYALFDKSLGEPWRAIPQSYFVDGLVDDKIRFEGFYAPPQLSASTLPFSGAELTRWMDRWDHVGQFGFMVKDPGAGSVHAGLNGRPLARYHVGREMLRCFREGTAALAELLLRGGAAEVACGVEKVGTVTTVEQARRIAKRRVAARHFRVMGFHPLGTCRVGAGPTEAVCDTEHRVFGLDNVYVMDGSSVPTSLGVNPQVTIMAMALRGASRLADRLG